MIFRYILFRDLCPLLPKQRSGSGKKKFFVVQFHVTVFTKYFCLCCLPRIVGNKYRKGLLRCFSSVILFIWVWFFRFLGTKATCWKQSFSLFLCQNAWFFEGFFKQYKFHRHYVSRMRWDTWMRWDSQQIMLMSSCQKDVCRSKTIKEIAENWKAIFRWWRHVIIYCFWWWNFHTFSVSIQGKIYNSMGV